MHHHQISPSALCLEDIDLILNQDVQLVLSDESRKAIKDCRTFLEKKLAEPDALFYGINTGFGSLCNIKISKEQVVDLQHNLVRSHACGMGDLVPPKLARLMLFLKIQNLSYGYSGIRVELVEKMIELFNKKVTPVIFQLGSLGASGDLAPLAHLSLPLLGEGEVWENGERRPSAEILKAKNISTLDLKEKEGIALLNGTQFSTAYACWSILKARKLWTTANFVAATSIDGFDCNLSPFDAASHRIRPHEGQLKTAAFIYKLLSESEIAQQPNKKVQDPYAFRCVPQVHGASYGAMQHVEQVILTEINSVTDNPNIIPEEDKILSAGNFHAQPIALALDYLAIALAELGSISERRAYQLITGQRGLPAFLTPSPGLNSGFMIPQYTAASIASQNKQLCTPASIDSIVSSNGQEDHVSMAANAATKLYRVVENVERLLAIEWMIAAQAITFRRPLQSAAIIEKRLAAYRQEVSALENDRYLSVDMHKTVRFLFG